MRLLPAMFFLAAITVTAPAADASENGVEGIKKFYRYVEVLLERHPDLKSLTAALEAKKELPDQAGTLPDPHLRFSIMNLPYDPLSFNEEGMTKKQVGVSQMFPAFGKLDMRKKIAQTDVEIASFMIPEKRMDLVKAARIAFYKLRFLQKAREIIKKNIGVLKGFIKVATTKYMVGKGLQQNVLHAQVELTKMNDRLRRVEQEIASTGKQLAVWAQIDVDADWQGITVEPLALLEGETDNLLEEAVENRPLFKNLRSAIKKAGQSVELARLGLKPDYTVGLAYGQRDEGPMGSRNDLVTAWVSLKIPWYHKTKQDKQIAEKIVLQDKARLDFVSVKLKLRYKIADLLEKEKMDSELLVLYDTGLMPQASQTVEASFAAYQVNKIDFLTLVSNQIALFNFEISRYRIEFNMQANRARLSRTLGRNAMEAHHGT